MARLSFFDNDFPNPDHLHLTVGIFYCDRHQFILTEEWNRATGSVVRVLQILTVAVERMERYLGAVLHTDLVAGLHFTPSAPTAARPPTA